MILPDVNILVYAFRSDAAGHDVVTSWLDRLLAGPEPFAVADVVLSGFYRVVTNPRMTTEKVAREQALEAAHGLRMHPRAVVLQPSLRQWELFIDLCRQVSATGNLVPDAYIASLAIANGCQLATNDRDFRRFRGLRTINPLEA